jgi:DNA adenine methylase
MPATYTPLRYPGGKAKLGDFLASVMRANRLVDAGYAEPYAGGAGAGLHLLFRGYATHLRLNDVDRGVASFWRAVVGRNEAFARAIERVPLTIAEWDRQKDALRTAPMGFDLGFAFFYLNRTNRSGIMNAGVIGGRDQKGEWGIDARFNRTELAARVRAIAPFRRQITVTRLDALEFLDELSTREDKLLTYLDPPYYQKGQELYPNFYSPEDHATIARYMGSYDHRWVMTYDACDDVRLLYMDRHVVDSELSYSARDVRRGKELVIFGPGVRPPSPSAGTRPTKRYRPGFELASP